MSFISKCTRTIAHEPGNTLICSTPDGKRIISSGDDGIIKVFVIDQLKEQDVSQDPTIIQHFKTQCVAIHANNHSIAAASDEHIACLFTMDKFEKLLFRGTISIQDILVSPNGTHVAVVSEGNSIKYVNINDITKISLLSGHTRPVKSLCFDPTGEYLASAGTDGLIKVWKISGEEGECVKSIEKEIDFLDVEDKEPFRMAWNPNGKFFAVPGKRGDILLIQRGSWKVLGNLKGGHVKPIVAVSWSSDGTHLVSVGSDNIICVWKVSKGTKKPIAIETHTCRVSSILFIPNTNSICLADEQGRLLYWENPTRPDASEDTDKAGVPSYLDVEADEDMDDDGSIGDSIGGSLDDFIDDDDGAGYALDIDKPQELNKYYADGKRKAIQELYKDNKNLKNEKFQTSTTYVEDIGPIQESFQPGSTPLQGNRRYLAFTAHGIIYTIDNQTHSNVSVEFHDRSQRPFHFQDHNNYDRACLAESGALFSSEATGTNPSTVFFKPFDGWSSKADWSVQLGEHESAKGLAITGKGPVIATDMYFLRFFTFSGIQALIRCLNGPIVSMTGSARHLFVVYDSGAPYHNDPCLSYFLMDVETKEILVSERLPISQGAVLTWIGFSDYGAPVTFDSRGILRLMNIHEHFAWIPIFMSTSQNKDRQETYWPVGVTLDEIICVICKGIQKFPVFPKPILFNFPLQIPILQLDTSNGVLEEKLLISTLKRLLAKKKSNGFETDEAHVKKLEIEMDKSSLLLIQNAVTSERAQRALDFCAGLNSIRGLDGAIRLAAQHHYPALAEKINQLKERRMNQELDGQNEIPSTEDIKDYIREELEKHIMSQQLSVPFIPSNDSLSRSMFEEDSSEALGESNVKESTDITEVIDTCAESNDLAKPKKAARINNPFAVSNKKRNPGSSNGQSLLNAIVTAEKAAEAEFGSKKKEMKRKNQTSLLQFSKKREATKIKFLSENSENEGSLDVNELEKENDKMSLQDTEVNSMN